MRFSLFFMLWGKNFFFSDITPSIKFSNCIYFVNQNAKKYTTSRKYRTFFRTCYLFWIMDLFSHIAHCKKKTLRARRCDAVALSYCP